MRINRDMLRTRHRERVLLHACLLARQPFVVDNTNVLAAERARFIAPAREAGFRVAGYFFPPDLRGALRRNARRTGAAVIPPKGVVGTLKRLEPPRHEEGFDRLYRVTIDAQGEFAVVDWPAGEP